MFGITIMEIVYKFNTGVNSTYVRSTVNEGLHLILDFPQNHKTYPNLDGDCLKLFIHNKSFSPRKGFTPIL